MVTEASPQGFGGCHAVRPRRPPSPGAQWNARQGRLRHLPGQSSSLKGASRWKPSTPKGGFPARNSQSLAVVELCAPRRVVCTLVNSSPWHQYADDAHEWPPLHTPHPVERGLSRSRRVSFCPALMAARLVLLAFARRAIASALKGLRVGKTCGEAHSGTSKRQRPAS